MGNKNSPWNNNGFLLLGSRSWLLLVQLVVVYLQRLLISNVCLLSRAASAGHRSPRARWGSAPLPGVEAEKRCAALGSCSRQGVPTACCALGCQGRVLEEKLFKNELARLLVTSLLDLVDLLTWTFSTCFSSPFLCSAYPSRLFPSHSMSQVPLWLGDLPVAAQTFLHHCLVSTSALSRTSGV